METTKDQFPSLSDEEYVIQKALGTLPLLSTCFTCFHSIPTKDVMWTALDRNMDTFPICPHCAKKYPCIHDT